MSRLVELSEKKHPYYCSNSNYYSNEVREVYDTMTAFLDEFEEADVDMNLVFRWDIIKDDEKSHYSAYVYLILQRKGIFKPIEIVKITESEVERFENYLKNNKKTIDALWDFNKDQSVKL